MLHSNRFPAWTSGRPGERVLLDDRHADQDRIKPPAISTRVPIGAPRALAMVPQ